MVEENGELITHLDEVLNIWKRNFYSLYYQMGIVDDFDNLLHGNQHNGKEAEAISYTLKLIKFLRLKGRPIWISI